MHCAGAAVQVSEPRGERGWCAWKRVTRGVSRRASHAPAVQVGERVVGVAGATEDPHHLQAEARSVDGWVGEWVSGWVGENGADTWRRTPNVVRNSQRTSWVP